MMVMEQTCLAFLFWFLVFLVSNVTNEKIGSIQFSVVKHQRCNNTILSTVKTRSKIECVATCQRTSGCDASNYIRQTRECQLLQQGANCDCSVGADTSSVYIQQKSMYSDYVIDCNSNAYYV